MAAPEPARRPLAFLVALYCAWISAGHHPFVIALEGARSPTDFTRDYVSARALSRGEPLSQLDGARGNAEAVSVGAEPVIILENSPFHLHPPPASLPLRLLVPLGFRGASAVWLGLSILALGALARLLVGIVARVAEPPVGPFPLFALLLLWPPTLTNFQLGQWSAILAALVAAGYSAWDADRRQRGAVWIAIATALKLTPDALFPFIALRDKRAAATFASTVAAAMVLALPLGGGFDAWFAFLHSTAPNVTHWLTWWHNTLSIHGLFARYLVGAHFARPLAEAPHAARALAWLVDAALVLTALAATRAASGRKHDRGVEGCVFAMWGVLAVVLNPLAWTHYALLLALPAALVWRATADAATPLSPRTRAQVRGALGAAIVGLTVPKETILFFARPFPSAPVKAPLLSLHLFAALLLFAAAGWVVRASRQRT
jgi:hypothetical protein